MIEMIFLAGFFQLIATAAAVKPVTVRSTWPTGNRRGQSVCGFTCAVSLAATAVCCLRIKPFFLPNDISTPSVRADSSS